MMVIICCVYGDNCYEMITNNDIIIIEYGNHCYEMITTTAMWSLLFIMTITVIKYDETYC